MNDRRTARIAGALGVGMTLGAVGFLVAADAALAGPKEAKKAKRAAVVGRAELPLGLQGLRGAGGNVVVPFTLVDPTRRATDVEVQYGIDRNSDGTISEDEYVPATEDRLDPRNTRRNRKPQLWVTAGDIGATHAFVWRSTQDVQTDRHETLLYRYTDQGRLIPDPANPGEFLFDDAQAGVRVRIRAVRGAGKSRLTGDWVVTDAFSLNNNTQPAMTIDEIVTNDSGTASDENIEIRWTAVDPDSEDANDNGRFDAGEDANGNGVFDQEQLGVAFDYYRLQPGDTPASLTDDELAALPWKSCTRASGLGDTDSFRETGASKVYGTPNGRQWTFVWNSVADVGTVRDQFILRARPVDQKRETGSFIYIRNSFKIDNRKIFASAAGGNSAIALSSARTGCTVTNLVYGLERSDASYGAPFQQVVVAGGSTTAAGNGTTGVDIFLVNSESADTTAASRVQFVAFSTARKYHSATALTDGRILFAGGFDASGNPTNTTEIYDPATRSMSAGPTLNTARARHTAVLLNSNDVAFIGGIGAGSTALNSIEIYRYTPAGDPTQPVETIPATLITAQHSVSAVVLGDQSVLLMNGIAGSNDAAPASGEAYIFDPAANPTAAGTPGAVKPKNPTVTPLTGASAPGAPRKFAGVTGLLDGNVLVSGGVSGGTVLDSLEVFNWKSRTFQPVNVSMADRRAQHVSALMGDGTVLLAGGAQNDPSGANAGVTGKGTILRLGANVSGAWDATFDSLNGNMVVARRGADTTVIMNGRPFIAGGVDASGATTTTCEVFTPDQSRNAAPKVYVSLPSSNLSHAYGATINYRAIDAEGDRVRLVPQFRLPGGTRWYSCTAQSDTIGGDVGEDLVAVTPSQTDVPVGTLAIDPVARNTAGDHLFIWSMASDIDRPNPAVNAGRIDGYNVRMLPYGAVRGEAAVSDPVNVFSNTKPLSYLVPLEDAIGVQNANQGGDIRLWAHVRDIDGAGTGPRAGDISQARFDYAVDVNNDGQISATNGEFFVPMTPATFQITGGGVNPVTGIQSWSESPFDASSELATRNPAKGWASFNWDALFDLGPPQSPTYTVRNVWVRVTPADDPLVEGFPYILRNRSGVPDQFVYTRDAQALYLEKFYPISAGPSANGPFSSVRTNEPIVMQFNGLVDPTTVNLTTIKIYRSNTQVLGAYQVQQNQPSAGKTRITFYPQVQSTVTGTNVYSLTSTQTIMFSGNEYRIAIPGYAAQRGPRDNTIQTIRPQGWSSTSQSTFQAVNSGVINGDSDSQYRFNTTTGTYNDGQAVAQSGSAPVSGGTIPQINGTSGVFTITFNHSIDATTAVSPNLVVRGNLTSQFVVPGRWSVTNTVNNDGTSSATLSFVPLLTLPPSDGIAVIPNSGLRGTNGLANGTATATTFSTASGTRYSRSVTETFTNTTNRDAATTASWGTDACDAGVLTGLQDGSTQPSGTTDLTISNGQTTTLTSTLYNYRNITVARGGRLILRASAPVTILAAGDVNIDGIVDFSGLEGTSGSCGNSSSYQYGPYNTTSLRSGGVGYNGGGAGGASRDNASILTMNTGDTGTSGTGTVGTGGAGGAFSSTYGNSYSYYYYGIGGGAGGGNGRAGLNGGFCSAYTTPVGTMALGGAAGGAADFSSLGITGGGGGGGGGANIYSSTYYRQSGGGGGAGAGAVTFLTTGSFNLNASGYINGQGGQGGTKAHYAGAGGGGAGGSLWIKSGNTIKLDGLIDLRGGRGGPAGYGYFSDTYMYYNATVYGTSRHGGDGGPGRLMVEAPNYVAGATDQVRVFGAMMVRQISSLPTTSLTATSAPANLTSSGSTGTQVVDLGGATDVRYSGNLDIPSTRIVRLKNGSLTTNRAVRIFVDGNVTISGTLNLNGNGAGVTASLGTMNSGDYDPLSASQASYTMYGLTYVTSAASYNSGYYGVVGGGDGGKPMNNTTAGNTNNNYEAGDGAGPQPGKHKIKSGTAGYVYSSGYPTWNYYSGDSGGGGGGNAGPGREGWAPYALHTSYNYQGAATDSTGAGVAASTRVSDGGPAGGVTDATTVTVTNISNLVGSGGGGGNAGGWGYGPYMGFAGMGGGGGGSVAIISQGTITVNSGATVSARGGDGNPPGAAYPYYYAHAAGGGGSGGTVYLAANAVTIASSTVESTATGATFDLRGGFGGGWRQEWTGMRQAYQWYNTHGHFGGDGGYGRLIIDWRTSLNGRTNTALVNRWGFEQTSFHDATVQYRALAGSATFKCRGIPGQGYFQSAFYDLGSLNPTVTSMTTGLLQNVGSYTLNGRGAQSHPTNVGAGTGAVDTSNLMPSAVTGSASMAATGWRWWRFEGSFTRFASTGAGPRIDNIAIGYTSDQ